jgi:DNA-binding MarR family transcriptional regulator
MIGRFLSFFSLADLSGACQSIPGDPARMDMKTSESLPELGSLSFLVRHVWLTMRSAVEAVLREFDLSVPQYATLVTLEHHPGFSVADVARTVASSRQAANELLAGLERQDLISRTPHLTDRRTHQLRLTDAGRKRLDEARPAVARREAELEAGFNGEQRTAVREWMVGVVEACGTDAAGH